MLFGASFALGAAGALGFRSLAFNTGPEQSPPFEPGLCDEIARVDSIVDDCRRPRHIYALFAVLATFVASAWSAVTLDLYQSWFRRHHGFQVIWSCLDLTHLTLAADQASGSLHLFNRRIYF